MANKSKPPTLNLEKKPLESKKDDIKSEITKRVKKRKEEINAEILTKLVLQKRIVVGVGNPEEFYEELINGFKKTLISAGANIPDELKERIKDNDGRIKDKDQGVRITRLSKHYGVVPKQ